MADPLSAEDYEVDFDEVLGYGTYGTVYSCIRKSDGQSFAIKIYKSSEASVEEINMLTYLKNFRFQNIVNIIDSIEINNRKAIVMEKLEGGEVFERIIHDGKFSEQRAGNCLKNLVTALIDLNSSASVLHRYFHS